MNLSMLIYFGIKYKWFNCRFKFLKNH
jgi:hypothetical protein